MIDKQFQFFCFLYIRYLRSKIDERFGVKFIHTVRGVGYVFRDAEA